LSSQNPATKSYLKQFNPNTIFATPNYKKQFIIINLYMSSSARLFVAKLFCTITADLTNVTYKTTHNCADTTEEPRKKRLCLAE
jgi:hypothetical protein